MGFGLQMGGVGALATLGGDSTLSSAFGVTVGGRELGLFGTTGFFLSAEAFTPAVAALFLFQMMFMDAACTIPTGALAERWKFASFVLFGFAMSTVIYPVYAHWVWGGGWLSALGRNYGLGHGHVDFAGSSAVHLTGGVAALVGARLVGPRIGKFDPDGTPRGIPGHNLALAMTGTFVLAFGWFGFNAGSTLAATDLRTAIVAVNTMLSSAAGAFAATLHTWRGFGKPDPTWMCNGMLAGLVAITAPCAFVDAPSAVLIGGLAGVLVVKAATFVEETLRIDDPVGAIAVHGANGAWGILALGLFANGSYGEGLNGVPGGVRGLFYGDSGQFFAALIGIGANVYRYPTSSPDVTRITRSAPDWHSSCTKSARLARSKLPENPSPGPSVRVLATAPMADREWGIRPSFDEQSAPSDSQGFHGVCERIRAITGRFAERTPPPFSAGHGRRTGKSGDAHTD